MAGKCPGELMQNCVMYDKADNLYLACFHVSWQVVLKRGCYYALKVGTQAI